MSRALLVLDTEFQRRKAQDWVWAAKNGSRVEFKGPQRSTDQNSLFWVLATEVATQLRWHGQKLSADDWKLQFLDALRRAKNEELRIVPNIDNTGFVNLSTSSSDLSKEEMSDMIELVYKFGAEHGVTFNNENPSEVAAPSSDGQGSDGSQALPRQTQAVAADPVPAAADQEAGEPEAADSQSAVPASDLITRNLMVEAVDKFMALAVDASVPDAKQRRSNVEFAKNAWKQALPTRLDFVKACFDTADAVVKGNLSASMARRYLEGLV